MTSHNQTEALVSLEESSQTTQAPLQDERRWYDVFSRIYRLKIFSIWLLLLIGCIFFYLMDYWIRTYESLKPLEPIPFRVAADACLIALLVGFAYEWIVRRETEEKLNNTIEEHIKKQTEGLKQLFQKQFQELKESIPDSLLLNQAVMNRLMGTGELDNVIRGALQTKSGDQQYGQYLYDGVLEKALGYEERWENYRCKITLSSLSVPSVSADVANKYYQAVIDQSYEVELKQNTFSFTCLTTIEEFNESVKDSSFRERWLFPPTPEFPVINADVYKVDYVKVDELNLIFEEKITEDGGLIVIGTHPQLSSRFSKHVAIHYRYSVKLAKLGHLLTRWLVYPTKNIIMELDYAGTDIQVMNVRDFFVSKTSPIIRYSPSRENAHKIEVEINEWTLPKGGVVFVWSLKSEFSKDYLKLLDTTKRPRSRRDA